MVEAFEFLDIGVEPPRAYPFRRELEQDPDHLWASFDSQAGDQKPTAEQVQQVLVGSEQDAVWRRQPDRFAELVSHFLIQTADLKIMKNLGCSGDVT